MNSKPIAGGLVVLPRYSNVNRIPIGRPRPGDIARDIVAEVNGGGGLTGETDGDRLATLFAAAPELLAVCRKAEEAMAEACDCGECGGCAVAEEIREAIAKATGGKPEAAPASPATEPNPLAAALRWALDSLPDDLDPDQQAAKAGAEALLSGIPATPATPDRLTDALVALQECVDLLKDSRVRFKICDGGRGNLGEAVRYHSAMKKAHAVLYPTH